MKKLIRWLLCVIGDHQWTSAAQEGIKPTEAQLAAGMIGFKHYATMYCKHCGEISRLSL
jgi:hypothetical protein